MTKTNIYIENAYKNKDINTEKYTEFAQKIFEYLLSSPEIYGNSCLYGREFETISFDFLFCDGNKTHEINREYRNKDYIADIITFAVFADSDENEKFVINGDINLGEIILALDKIDEEAQKKGVSFESELLFLISHGMMHLLGFDHQTEMEYNFVIRYQKDALRYAGIEYDKV